MVKGRTKTSVDCRFSGSTDPKLHPVHVTSGVKGVFFPCGLPAGPHWCLSVYLLEFSVSVQELCDSTDEL